MAFNEDRVILNLTDSELEDLVKKWLARLKGDCRDGDGDEHGAVLVVG